jgi:hypothetical protein
MPYILFPSWKHSEYKIFFFFLKGADGQDGADQYVHIGDGIVLFEDDYQDIHAAFGKTWPSWSYGTRDVNSSSRESLTHRQAFDLLIGAVWPSGTEVRFFGLEGFPPRADYHRQRFTVCIGNIITVIIFNLT